MNTLPEPPKLPRVKPPADETRKVLERGAREIARLLTKRVKLQRAIVTVDTELAAARKILRDLIRDVATPAEAGVQADMNDLDDKE